MTIPKFILPLLSHAAPRSAAAREVKEINRALVAANGIKGLLVSVRNLPLSLSTSALRAEGRLEGFLGKLDTALPTRQDYRDARASIDVITADLKRMDKTMCRHQRKPGSANHDDYTATHEKYIDILKVQHTIPTKYFRAR